MRSPDHPGSSPVMRDVRRHAEERLTSDNQLVLSIFEGWCAYQEVMTKAIAPLDEKQLELRAGPNLRSVREIAAHIIGARARWFFLLMGDGGDEFATFGKWDRRGSKARSTEELVNGLEATRIGIQGAIQSWTPDDWEETWPGEDDSEPEVITRQWVIWHLIEHDLHHGVEISITLGAHGMRGIALWLTPAQQRGRTDRGRAVGGELQHGPAAPGGPGLAQGRRARIDTG
jgi:uncharacterized damage-inducible protein DinB